MRIYATDGRKRYKLEVTREWAIKHDNGALLSCGLTVGQDITERQLQSLQRQGRVVEVQQLEYDHSGCLSYCKLRGDDHCQW